MVKHPSAALAVVVCLLIPVALQAQLSLRNEQLVQGRYQLTYTNAGYAHSVVTVAGRKFLSFTGAAETEEERHYPSRELFIALPPHSQPALTITVTQQHFLEESGITNLPAAGPLHYTVKGYLWIGSYYCMHITIDPFWYDAAAGRIAEVGELRIDIALPAPAVAQPAAIHEIAPQPIDNPHEGAQWKAVRPEYTTSGSDSWIDYTQEYLKIGVAQDGIYTLSYADLQASGVPVGSLNPRSFKLFLKGKEVPIYVGGEQDNAFNAGDYIEFLGRRNYGDLPYREIAAYGTPYHEYLNRYSDTTIYWLSWTGAAGRRVDTVIAAAGIPTDTTAYYDELVRSEANLYWDFKESGDQVRLNSPEIDENETWNGGAMDVGSSPVSFDVSNLYPGKPAHAYVKLANYASDVDVNAHNLSLSINAAPGVYDSGYIDKYVVKVLKADFLSALLTNGSNQVIVHSYPTLNTINRVITDWFELEYPRYLTTGSDSLSFSYRSAIGPKVSMIVVTGLSSVPMSLYRFTWADSAVTKITNFSRTGDTLRFVDTIAAGRTYFLIAGNRTHVPFIFYRKKFVNLRSGTNKADYLAVTHPYFSPQAASYLTFISQTYHVTTKLVDVNDIMDEFNYGFWAPEPIREFLRSTHVLWQQPSPQYVFLIGKGTYDYYGNKSKYFGIKRVPNFVPPYGNPVSDTWFTIWDSTGSMIPQMDIGRVPVNTVEEFQAYFSKHQKFVSKGYDDWNKRYIFFAGGSTTEPGQIDQMKAVNDQIIANLVAKPPIGGLSSSFYKTLSPPTNFGPASAQYFQNAIEQGGMFIAYIGHSGTQTWDNSITDVAQLANIRDRNPLITDFGCSTGKYAEPDVLSFAELAVSGLRGQAIDYIGNSSLGFTTTAETFPYVFYKKLLIDTLATIGETHRLAKIDFARQYGTSYVYGLFLLTNTLFGDPITSLPLPTKPNFTFTATTIAMQPQRLTEQTDSVMLMLTYSNLGKVTNDSLTIQVADEYQGSVSSSVMLRRRIPLFTDSLAVMVPVKGKAGEHAVTITLDPLRRIDELYENDNVITYQFLVTSSTVRNLAIAPAENQTAGTILFLNPSTQPASPNFLVEVASNSSFSQSRNYQVPYDTFYTRFRLDSTFLGSRIWLRTKFDQSSLEGLTYSYVYGRSDNYLLGDPLSFASMTMNGLGVAGDHIVLDTGHVLLRSESAGFNDGNTAVISKNGVDYVPASTQRGFHVCQFDASTYEFIRYINYDVQAGLAVSTNFVTMLDTLSTRYFLAFAISNDVGSNSSLFPQTLKTALQAYGSYYIDSVAIGDSWSMIGWKGAARGTVPEKYGKRFSGHSVVSDTTFAVPNINGTFETQPIGPVAEWKNVQFSSSVPSGGVISVAVVGFKVNGAADTVKNIILKDSTIDLAAVNAQVYPTVKLAGAVTRAAGQPSPTIRSIAVNYTPLAELGANYQTVRLFHSENGALGKELAAGDTVIQGEKVAVQCRVYNAGGVTAKKFGVHTGALWDNSTTESISTIIIDSIPPFAYRELSALYNSSLGSGRRSIRIAIDPDTVVRELFKDNNVYTFPIYVKKDSSKPFLPNLFISQNAMHPLVSPITDEKDSAAFVIVYGNSGAFINDSITVSVRLSYKNAVTASWTLRRKYPAELDTISLSVPILKRAGEYQLQVDLDPFGLITETSELDNTAIAYFTVLTTDFKILQPTAFSASWFPKIIFLNPTTTAGSPVRTADFEIDTLSTYATAATAQLPMSEFATTFDLGAFKRQRRYYWRIRQQQSGHDWTTGSFFLGDLPAFTLGQADSIGWDADSFVHAAFLPSGAQIVDTRTTITALSAGFDDGRTGSVVVNGINVLSPIFGSGHNIVVLDTAQYAVVARRRFDVATAADASDSLAQFVSTIAPGAIVVDVVVDDGANNLNQAARDALQTIGSGTIDKLSRHDSWAIIGRKGAQPGTVPETYRASTTGAAQAETTFVRREYAGTIISLPFGPVSNVTSFAMTGSIPAGTQIQTRFVGTRSTNAVDTVLLTSGSSLSTLLRLTTAYHEARIVFTLQGSSSASPTVTAWTLSASASTELAASQRSSTISRSQVMEGEAIDFTGWVYNISSAPADSVIVQLTVNDAGFDRPLKQQKYTVIPANDSVTFTYSYSSRGRRGSHAFTLTIDPLDSLIEQSKDNNTVTIPFLVQTDSLRPELQVDIDGLRIVDGDYVSKHPVIAIRYTDNNPTFITRSDSSNFSLRLNNDRVYFLPGVVEMLTSSTPGFAQVNWTPDLPGGENIIQISATDVSGNASDTTLLFVNVSSTFMLADVYNIPNPFPASTHFTFNILGPVNPDEVWIKIFTVAGRLIQDIPYTCKIGFNNIAWDGRDKDGDEIANGVYFYKIIVKEGDKQTSAVGKLVKMK